jgi:hypothetical protein
VARGAPSQKAFALAATVRLAGDVDAAEEGVSGSRPRPGQVIH